jgi:hypothetical protein
MTPLPLRRIHIIRDGAEGFIRPLPGTKRWGLYGYDGRLRVELQGDAPEVRREAKRVIDINPDCFPVNPNGES